MVTGKLDVREAAAALPEVDPLAEDDHADDLDADLTLDADELDEALEEVDALEQDLEVVLIAATNGLEAEVEPSLENRLLSRP